MLLRLAAALFSCALAGTALAQTLANSAQGPAISQSPQGAPPATKDPPKLDGKLPDGFIDFVPLPKEWTHTRVVKGLFCDTMMQVIALERRRKAGLSDHDALADMKRAWHKPVCQEEKASAQSLRWAIRGDPDLKPVYIMEFKFNNGRIRYQGSYTHPVAGSS